MTEVTVARSSGRGDDGDALGQEGHGELFVERKHPLALQLVEDLLAVAHQVAQGIGRVDVGDVQTVAIEFVKRHLHLYQYADASGKGVAGSLLEIGCQQAIDTAPDGATGLGYKGPRLLIALHELQVAVAVAIEVYLAQLGLYPVGIGHASLHGGAHQAIEFE